MQRPKFDSDGLPVPLNTNHADTLELDNEGLPVPKKKDTTSGSKDAVSASSNSPVAPKPITPSGFDSPFSTLPGTKPQAKITTQDGFEIPVNTSNLPIKDPDAFVAGLQKKVSTGAHTDNDIMDMSMVSGKSPVAIKGYMESTAKGMATERVEDLTKTRDKLQSGINAYNAKMMSNFKADDIFSSAQKTSEFLQTIKKQFSPESLKQNERIYQGSDMSFVKDIENYKKLLEDHTVKLSVVEGEKNGDSPDVIKRKIAERTNPDAFKKAERAKATPTGMDSISDTDVSPFKVVGALVDEVFGTKKQDELLNSVKGEADLKYNKALGDHATDQISKGILSQDEEMVKKGQEDLARVDNDVVYKYPSLLQREIARDVSRRIAEETGQLEGSSTEHGKMLEKIFGTSEGGYYRKMKQLGYFDNPKTKDAANYLVDHTELFSDASYLGSAINSFGEPLKDLGLSIGDITGGRTEKDIYSDVLKDESFPSETPGIKKSAGTVRNIVNTTSNLAGMTAITLGTAGAGAELGMAAKAAEHLAAYTSFGLPSWDRSYKDAFEFSDNDKVRGLYATMNALVMSEGGRLFDLGKFANKIPGVSEDLQSLAKKIGERQITIDGARELLGQTKNKVADFFTKYGKNVTKGAATMAGFNATENILKAAFGDPNTNADEILGKAAGSFYNGVLGMSIMGGFGAAADMRNEGNTTYKGIIYKAAQNHDALADIFKKAKEKGYITPEVYTQKMSVLEGARMAKSMVDLTESEKQIPLTDNQKSVFVANKTTSATLKQKLKNVTNENEKATIESQIARLDDQAHAIFDGLKFNQVLEPLYDLHTAEKEYSKAQEDIAKGTISDDEFQSKKDKFEKLQYHYFEGGMEAQSRASETKRLLNKGIEEGKISDSYKAYAQEPEDFLKFVSDQAHGLMDDGSKSPYGGNEANMRKEFGNAIVDHALDSHPLKEEAKKPAPIIVRHAEEEQHVPGEKNDNPQLSNAGKKQAEDLGKEFKEKGVTQIIASPVDRALDTANIASKESGASVKQDERLAEYQPEKESLDEFANRVHDALGDVSKLGPETAVVTHGEVLKMVEALQKNSGDVKAAKADFDNSKEYDNGEQYTPPVQEDRYTDKDFRDKILSVDTSADADKVIPVEKNDNGRSVMANRKAGPEIDALKSRHDLLDKILNCIGK